MQQCQWTCEVSVVLAKSHETGKCRSDAGVRGASRGALGPLEAGVANTTIPVISLNRPLRLSLHATAYTTRQLCSRAAGKAVCSYTCHSCHVRAGRELRNTAGKVQTQVAEVLTFDRSLTVTTAPSPRPSCECPYLGPGTGGYWQPPGDAQTDPQNGRHRARHVLQAGHEQLSIAGDPWSTTASSAAHSPCRSTQLLLLPAAQARPSSCCAASKTCPTLQQLVDCSSILEGSARMPHVTRAPCNQHVPHESASVWAEPGCAERRC